MIRLAQLGDASAFARLVEANQGLVGSVVKRFRNRVSQADWEDLFQIGMIGLIKAIERFDLQMQVCFSTYAMPLVMGEIRRFLRDDGMVKVSRSLKETGMRLRRIQENLEKQTGQSATLEQLQTCSGIPSETITLALEACAGVESLQSVVYESDGKELALEQQLADPHDEENALLDHLLVEQLLGRLDEREREIIRLRYFEDCTQSEVAKRLGMTQVQVSRAEKKMLEKMRIFI